MLKWYRGIKQSLWFRLSRIVGKLGFRELACDFECRGVDIGILHPFID